jgi:hypothetical protein
VSCKCHKPSRKTRWEGASYGWASEELSERPLLVWLGEAIARETLLGFGKVGGLAWLGSKTGMLVTVDG